MSEIYKKFSVVQVMRCVDDYDELDDTYDTVKFSSSRRVHTLYGNFRVGDIIIVTSHINNHMMECRYLHDEYGNSSFEIHPLEVDLIA